MPQLIERVARAVNAMLRPAGIAILRLRNVENRQPVPGISGTLAELDHRLSALEESAAKLQALSGLTRYAMRTHWRLADQLEQARPIPSEIACLLCEYRDSRPAFESLECECKFDGGHLRRYRCPSCGVIFGPMKMFELDEEMVHLEYSSLYRIYAEDDSSDAEIRPFHTLQPRREGKYLNYGCGGGWSKSIERLRNEGWDVLGFEPNCATGSNHVLTTWTELSQHRFDGVYSHDLIEHLFDPVATLRQLSGILTPSGRQAHATACFGYRHEYSRFHVFFFTGRSPEVLAARAGLKIAGWVRDEDFISCLFEPA